MVTLAEELIMSCNNFVARMLNITLLFMTRWTQLSNSKALGASKPKVYKLG